MIGSARIRRTFRMRSKLWLSLGADVPGGDDDDDNDYEWLGFIMS